jgi:hypothetical protein
MENSMEVFSTLATTVPLLGIFSKELKPGLNETAALQCSPEYLGVVWFLFRNSVHIELTPYSVK